VGYIIQNLIKTRAFFGKFYIIFFMEISLLSIKKILLEHYPFLLEGESGFKVKLFVQGYMNHTLCLEFPASGKKYVVIFYNANRYRTEKSFQRLTQIDDIASYLDENGIPARTSVLNKMGGSITKLDFQFHVDGENLMESSSQEPIRRRFFAIYNYLPGKTLPWEAYTRRHLRSLGMMMARMHTKLRRYSGNISSIPVWDLYFANDSKEMLAYFLKNEKSITQKLALKINEREIKALYQKIRDLIPTTKPCYQLTHCDFVRGNVLFSDVKERFVYPITGVLDFEKIMLAPIEVDLARTLAFLFVDCKYKSEEDILRYFISEGYSGKLAPQRYVDSMETEFNDINIKYYMLYFWLRDLWKLLQCNPYEDLRMNYHFKKTVEILRNNSKLIS